MKTIENIFAFSIICFSVYTKSISILLALVLVVLVPVLVIVLVFCPALVFCSRLNQLDEQQALSSSSSSHLTMSSSSARVRIARVVAMLNFQTLVVSQLKQLFSCQYDSSLSYLYEDSSHSSSLVVDFALSKNDHVILSSLILVHEEENQ
jgi:hypothetical protein